MTKVLMLVRIRGGLWGLRRCAAGLIRHSDFVIHSSFVICHSSFRFMPRIERAVILAAGRGTRMRELTAELPKPMIAVRGRPVLQHIVEGLRDAGIGDLLLIVGYRADAVRNFFGDGSRLNIAIQYTTQTVQDGTGRVVELARDFVTGCPFILAYGDILIAPANYKRVVDLPDDVEAFLTVTRGEDVTKGGAVFLDDKMLLVDLREKPKP